MKNQISRSCSVLHIAMVALLLLPAFAEAIDYPANTLADPLWLRACPVVFGGSSSEHCETMGLIGPVEKISYPASDKPDQIYKFDKLGRVAETHRRIRDIFGGWGIRIFSYATDGRLNSITYNGKPNQDIHYAGNHLSEIVFHANKTKCKYSYLKAERESLNLEANCNNSYRDFMYHVELDSRGRILMLDEKGAMQMNLNGALDCTYDTSGKNAYSVCTTGYYSHKYEYDGKGRPISYIRKLKSGKVDLVLSYSYVDDNLGNWIAQTTHYVEISSNNKLPADYVRTRSIDYFK